MASRSITFSTTEYERRRGWESERTVSYRSESMEVLHTSTQSDQMMRAQGTLAGPLPGAGLARPLEWSRQLGRLE